MAAKKVNALVLSFALILAISAALVSAQCNVNLFNRLPCNTAVSSYVSTPMDETHSKVCQAEQFTISRFVSVTNMSMTVNLIAPGVYNTSIAVYTNNAGVPGTRVGLFPDLIWSAGARRGAGAVTQTSTAASSSDWANIQPGTYWIVVCHTSSGSSSAINWAADNNAPTCSTGDSTVNAAVGSTVYQSIDGGSFTSLQSIQVNFGLIGCIYTPSPTPSPSSSITPSTSVTPSVTSSRTTSPSPSVTPSHSPSVSASNSPIVSPSPSVSPSTSRTASPSPSQAASASVTPSITSSPSVTPSVTNTPSTSRTTTPSRSISPSVSVTPSSTQAASVSASGSITPSHSRTSSPSRSISPSVSITPSATITPSSSHTSSPSRSITASVSITPSSTRAASVSPSTSVTPSVTPSGSPSHSVTPSGTASPSSSRSGSVTPSTSASASVSPSQLPSGTNPPSASVTPSNSRTASPSPSNSQTPSVSPSQLPSGTQVPSGAASPSPSVTPSASRSVAPSGSGAASPSPSPSASVSPSTGASPSSGASRSPSPSPSPSRVTPPPTGKSPSPSPSPKYGDCSIVDLDKSCKTPSQVVVYSCRADSFRTTKAQTVWYTTFNASTFSLGGAAPEVTVYPTINYASGNQPGAAFVEFDPVIVQGPAFKLYNSTVTRGSANRLAANTEYYFVLCSSNNDPVEYATGGCDGRLTGKCGTFQEITARDNGAWAMQAGTCNAALFGLTGCPPASNSTSTGNGGDGSNGSNGGNSNNHSAASLLSSALFDMVANLF